ncbi:hypothetical protein BC826DRAFT_1109972 [Russula brevipes]|nr:hypothetical protein BC826DRAFT_1109972 [Russula brevipes]
MALDTKLCIQDAKLHIQEACKQCYTSFNEKQKAMLKKLEEAEWADRQAKSAMVAKKHQSTPIPIIPTYSVYAIKYAKPLQQGRGRAS